MSIMHKLKIRLIPTKNHLPRSFYKSSQIKFQSLSKTINNFRTRSNEKTIKFQNPWLEIKKQQIDLIAQRLDDKVNDLYDIIKQKNVKIKQQNHKAKFNRLNTQQATKMFRNIQKNNRLVINTANLTQKSYNINQTSSSFNYKLNKHKTSSNFNYKAKSTNFSFKKSDFSTGFTDPIRNQSTSLLKSSFKNMSKQKQNKENKYLVYQQLNKMPSPQQIKCKMLQKIYQRKLEYERQMKKMFKQKQIVIHTDLPKINKIKNVTVDYQYTKSQSLSKLTPWKPR